MRDQRYLSRVIPENCANEASNMTRREKVEDDNSQHCNDVSWTSDSGEMENWMIEQDPEVL